MNYLKGKNILIFQQRNWALNIGHFLAKKLKAEGCGLAAVTLKKSTDKFIKNQSEVNYKSIINIDEILDDPNKYLGKREITLKEICQELKLHSVWPMLHSDRKLVRSYRDKYYYSFRQNIPDEFIVAFIKAYYLALKDLFLKFKPDLVLIATFISEEHLMLKLFAEKFGISVISITDSKVPGYYIFASDELCRRSELRDRFLDLHNGRAESANLKKAGEFINNFRKNFQPPTYNASVERQINLWRKIRSYLSPLKQIYNFYLNPESRINHIKIIDPTPDYKPPKIILRDWWCQKRYEKFFRNYKYYPLNKLKKFVFFPLKVTPEGNVDLMCPLYNNQIELARQIAMSLPDDYMLVTREHPAMIGLRPPSYLEKIDKTPNVKIIDYRIPIEQVLKKTDLIINTYSTTFFESAFYYKPVIMLMESGIFELLPNVFKHTDLSTLTDKIKKVLSLNLKSPAYERQLENYIAAVFDVGFDYDHIGAWELNKGGKDELWFLYKREMERLLK